MRLLWARMSVDPDGLHGVFLVFTLFLSSFLGGTRGGRRLKGRRDGLHRFFMAWRVLPGTPDAPHPPWVHQQRRGRNGDPPPCGPRNHCRAVGEPPVNLLESGALWRDFGPGVGENASSDPFQLQYMCPEVGGPKSNNLGANLIGGGRGERRHADRDVTPHARLGCVVVSLASPSQPGPMPMAFPAGETEMDSCPASARVSELP